VDHHDHARPPGALEGVQGSRSPHGHDSLTDRGDDEQREEEDDEEGADVDGCEDTDGRGWTAG
jgi:hypothetical protein